MLYFSPWKSVTIWLIVLIGIVFAAPNLINQSTLAGLPDWMPKRQMTLGLDLQGGSHILLEIDRNELIEDRLDSARDEVRVVLRDARIGYTGLSESGRTVQVRVRDQDAIAQAREVLAALTEPVSSGMFGTGVVTELAMSEPEPGLFRFTLTEEGINYRINTALSQSIEVVGRRVNELGTTEPIIQRQGTERILVQVPGLDDPERLESEGVALHAEGEPGDGGRGGRGLARVRVLGPGGAEEGGGAAQLRDHVPRDAGHFGEERHGHPRSMANRPREPTRRAPRRSVTTSGRSPPAFRSRGFRVIASTLRLSNRSTPWRSASASARKSRDPSPRIRTASSIVAIFTGSGTTSLR